jgi:hypothetical protein
LGNNAAASNKNARFCKKNFAVKNCAKYVWIPNWNRNRSRTRSINFSKVGTGTGTAINHNGSRTIYRTVCNVGRVKWMAPTGFYYGGGGGGGVAVYVRT